MKKNGFHLRAMLNFFINLKDNRNGSVALIVGLTMSLIILAIAIGVDLGRGYFARSRIGYALDAALLATSGELPNLTLNPATQQTQLNTYATRFFNLNFPPNFLGATVNNLNVTAVTGGIVPDQVSISVDITVPTIFGNVVSNITKNSAPNSFEFVSSASASRGNKVVELALVLDNTGSMGKNTDAGNGMTRMAALKAAATTLINTIYANTKTQTPPFTAIVPFTDNVNILNYPQFLSSGEPNTQDFPVKTNPWQGCIDERTISPGTINSSLIDDTPYTSTPFLPYYYQGGAYTGSTSLFYTISNSSQTSYYDDYGNQVNISSRNQNSFCTFTPLSGLSSDKTFLLNKISSMQAGGATAIYKGLVWGWRTISPRWQGLWNVMDSNTKQILTNRPASYNTPDILKIIVLLTDGDNSVEFTTQGDPGTTCKNPLVTSKVDGIGECTSVLDNRLLQLCTTIKSKNILIYTIGLGAEVAQSSNSQRVLSSCATSPDKFFPSPTADQLNTAFNAIAANISLLRLTQ